MLSNDISKLWLNQPHTDDFTDDRNDRDETHGLFSIIKIEEEHKIISETIKQVKQDNVKSNKLTQAEGEQAETGKGVMMESFPKEEAYQPILGKLLPLTRKVGHVLTPTQLSNSSLTQEMVIRHTSNLKAANELIQKVICENC